MFCMPRRPSAAISHPHCQWCLVRDCPHTPHLIISNNAFPVWKKKPIQNFSHNDYKYSNHMFPVRRLGAYLDHLLSTVTVTRYLSVQYLLLHVPTPGNQRCRALPLYCKTHTLPVHHITYHSYYCYCCCCYYYHYY